MIAGLTIQERLQSVIKKSSMIRPMIPQPKDIADPHGREFGMFCVAAEQTNGAIRKILKSMRKHRTVIPAPSAPKSLPDSGEPTFNALHCLTSPSSIFCMRIFRFSKAESLQFSRALVSLPLTPYCLPIVLRIMGSCWEHAIDVGFYGLAGPWFGSSWHG